MQENPLNSSLIRINNIDWVKKFADWVKKSVIFTLSWVSWAWKDTVIDSLFNELPWLFVKPIPFTTREPRKWEIDWLDYFFLSFDEYKELENNWLLFNSSYQFWNFYWFTKEEVDRIISLWKIPFFNVWPKVTELIKKENDWRFDVFRIFLEAPGKFTWIKRLTRRDWIYELDEYWNPLRNEKWKKVRKDKFLDRIKSASKRREEAKQWIVQYEAVLINWKLEETVTNLRQLCMNVIDWKLEL